MNETDGLAYLRTFPDFEMGNVSAAQTFGLERVLALLDAVGSPHLRLPVIHLAGTKGKGSTAAMLASVLRASGYRTGLFTQPHLLRLNERFTIDGEPITDAELSAIMLERIRPAMATLAAQGVGGVQQFEAQVALAFLWFEARAVEVVVLETGLGGRLDATNVVPLPLATVLTPIGHDHMAVLGDTLEAIAGEKAAIVKPGVPAIAAPQPAEAARVFEARCRAQRAPLLLGGRDWQVEAVESSLDGTRCSLRVNATAITLLGAAPAGGWTDDPSGALTIPDLSTPLLGAYQAINAAAAALTSLVVAAHLSRVTLAAVRHGLANVSWPGRLQIIAHNPTIILDGAHTAESARALAEAMRTLFGGRRIVLVLGIQRDKDIPAVVAPLAALASVAVATQARHPRAAEARLIGEALHAAGCPEVEAQPLAPAALARAQSLASPDDVILVTGSLYLEGEILASRQSPDDAPPVGGTLGGSRT